MEEFLSFLMRVFCIDSTDPNACVAIATWAGVIIAIVTLIVLFSVNITQVRQLRKESHRQLLMNIMQNWESDSMLAARKTLWDLITTEGKGEQLANRLYELDEENDEKIFKIIKISNNFETIGTMLKSKSDMKTIEVLIGDMVVSYFELLQGWIIKVRQESPDFCINFERIYKYCKEKTNTTT